MACTTILWGKTLDVIQIAVNYSRCNVEIHLQKVRCDYTWTHNTLINVEL